MSFNALVVGGNGKGLGGFGFGKGKTGGNAIQRGMMDMFKNLHFHDLYGRTIPHIVSAENTKTEVVLRPAKTSRGIKAHRAIAAICQCLGIFDISAKVTGRREEHNVVRATFKALRKLESPQDAALRRGMQIIDLSRQGPPLPTPLEEAIASQQRADKDRQRRWEERKATVGSKPWDTGFRQNRRRPSGDRARW